MDWQAQTFDWNHARAFLASAQYGSLSAAARVMNTTQPTLGRQVSALESALGVTLFERVGGGLVLTQNGSALLEHVRNMADAANSLALSAEGCSEAIEGLVSISATEAMAAFVLPPVLARLRAQVPSIDIEVIATNESSDLMRREADIAIRAYQPKELDLIARKIPSRKARLYASKSLVRTLGQVDSPKDLQASPFLGFDHSDTMIEELNRRGFNVSSNNFPVVSQNHLVQWEMVKQGLGIGFMLSEVGDMEPSVESVLPTQFDFDVELWLVVHRELNTSRRLRLVFDFLVQHLI